MRTHPFIPCLQCVVEEGAGPPAPCASNKYGHNFEGRFCVCDGPYLASDTMFQVGPCSTLSH